MATTVDFPNHVLVSDADVLRLRQLVEGATLTLRAGSRDAAERNLERMERLLRAIQEETVCTDRRVVEYGRASVADARVGYRE